MAINITEDFPCEKKANSKHIDKRLVIYKHSEEDIPILLHEISAKHQF